MMSRKMIMINAHRIAKLIVKEIGDYEIALSLALKNVWHAIKTWNKKRFTKESLTSAAHYLTTPNYVRKNIKIATSYYEGIPLWIMENNLLPTQFQILMSNAVSPKISKETEKAIDFEFDTDSGIIYMWCPKSVYKSEYKNILAETASKPEYQYDIAKVINA